MGVIKFPEGTNSNAAPYLLSFRQRIRKDAGEHQETAFDDMRCTLDDLRPFIGMADPSIQGLAEGSQVFREARITDQFGPHLRQVYGKEKWETPFPTEWTGNPGQVFDAFVKRSEADKARQVFGCGGTYIPRTKALSSTFAANGSRNVQDGDEIRSNEGGRMAGNQRPASAGPSYPSDDRPPASEVGPSAGASPVSKAHGHLHQASGHPPQGTTSIGPSHSPDRYEGMISMGKTDPQFSLKGRLTAHQCVFMGQKLLGEQFIDDECTLGEAARVFGLGPKSAILLSTPEGAEIFQDIRFKSHDETYQERQAWEEKDFKWKNQFPEWKGPYKKFAPYPGRGTVETQSSDKEPDSRTSQHPAASTPGSSYLPTGRPSNSGDNGQEPANLEHTGQGATASSDTGRPETDATGQISGQPGDTHYPPDDSGSSAGSVNGNYQSPYAESVKDFA